MLLTSHPKKKQIWSLTLKRLVLLVAQSVTERSLKLVLFSISDIYVRNQQVVVKIAYKVSMPLAKNKVQKAYIQKEDRKISFDASFGCVNYEKYPVRYIIISTERTRELLKSQNFRSFVLWDQAIVKKDHYGF